MQQQKQQYYDVFLCILSVYTFRIQLAKIRETLFVVDVINCLSISMDFKLLNFIGKVAELLNRWLRI